MKKVFSIGGLLGKRAILEGMRPYQTGGDMIEFVYDETTTWNELPHKLEAGTPNAANAVGLAAAADYLESIGMDEVLRHERELMQSAQFLLSRLDGIRIYGPPAPERSGVLSFTLEDVHPHDLATILDGEARLAQSRLRSERTLEIGPEVTERESEGHRR